MTREQIFEVWAPPASAWSQWAKPVLFSHMSTTTDDEAIEAINVDWAWPVDRSLAIVADLPGDRGVMLGLSLAGVGYRPVPLYNACPEGAAEVSLVEVRPILKMLNGAASALAGIKLVDDAPPVFLLDANRGIRRFAAEPGMLDNRSISLPTDFPSGLFLLSHGIQKILLVQETTNGPQADLSHRLRRWQEAGLQIEAKDLNHFDAPHQITIRRPNGFKILFYNFLSTIGLKSGRLGGFGGRLPVPSSG